MALARRPIWLWPIWLVVVGTVSAFNGAPRRLSTNARRRPGAFTTKRATRRPAAWPRFQPTAAAPAVSLGEQRRRRRPPAWAAVALVLMAFAARAGAAAAWLAATPARAAAAAYGAAAFSRFAASWPLYCTIPLTAGVFNALTNKLAVTMMFEPVRYRGRRPFGWQGIVPKAARRMGGDVADLLMRELLDVEAMVSRVDADHLAALLVDAPEVVELGVAACRKTFPSAPEGLVRATLTAPRLRRVAASTIRAVQANVTQAVDVRRLCVDRLCDDPRQLCDLFRRCGKPELDAVVTLGGWGGLLLGVLQMGAWALYPRAWTLALGGAFVGFATDWAALKILFSPVEPRKIGPLTVQGLFLRRQAEVSADFADFVAAELVAPEHLWRALLTGPRRAAVVDHVVAALRAELPGLVASAGDVPAQLAELADRGLAELAADPALTRPTEAYLARALDVETAVRDAMAALPPAKFERVLHPVFEQDEATLIAVGMTLGGLVGLAQVPLY